MSLRRTVGCALLLAGLIGTHTEANGKEERWTLSAAEQVCTLTVAGMTCGGCATAVRLAALKIAGVSKANVSFEKGLAVVTYDPVRTNPEAIAKTITERTGFTAAVQKATAKR